jgi:hypothetical protein
MGALIVFAMLGGTRIVLAGKDAADETSAAIRGEALRADMRFLADDLLEGRGTGTRGHEIAAKFMASEFEAMGLAPAGDDESYFQSVPLRAIEPDQERSTLSLWRAEKEQVLIFGQDFISLVDPGRTEVSVEAPVVYVGFGVTAPEQSYDDYAGIDVKGKIVALVSGAPPQFEPTMRAHYSSGAVKAANAAAHGAVGAIVLDSPAIEQIHPFIERLPSSPDAISAAATEFSDEVMQNLGSLDNEFFAYFHNLTDLLFAFVSKHPKNLENYPKPMTNSNTSSRVG